jgi:hypothetical protein
VYVDWAEAHIVGISLWVNNNDEQIRSLHLERWNVPESHHIDWREGDDFVSALKKWPAENQKLAHVFSEPGLAHLRKCRMKVLEMILLDCYVGEPEIEESCPAETLN